MTTRRLPFLLVALFLGLAVPRAASAATIQLNCILNTTPCTPSGSSFGTVTLDQVGAGVRVTVDLAGTGEKFRDLLLNYSSTTNTTPTLTDDDPNNAITYVSNGFVLNPYGGLFDVGDGTTQQGWDGDDPYTVLLNAAGGLTLADFLVKDSLNGVMVALHIQNIGPNGCEAATCVPGTTGSGSLKIGGSVGTPGQQEFPSVPEPASLLLMGTGIAAAARRLRRNKRSV